MYFKNVNREITVDYGLYFFEDLFLGAEKKLQKCWLLSPVLPLSFIVLSLRWVQRGQRIIDEGLYFDKGFWIGGGRMVMNSLPYNCTKWNIHDDRIGLEQEWAEGRSGSISKSWSDHGRSPKTSYSEATGHLYWPGLWGINMVLKSSLDFSWPELFIDWCWSRKPDVNLYFQLALCKIVYKIPRCGT